MKTITILGAAAAALLVCAPAAHAQAGYVGLDYTRSSVEIFGSDTDFDTWRGEGAFGMNSGSGLGGQVEGSWGNVDTGSGDADIWTLAGHLWWDFGNWRAGGVVATTQLDDSGSDGETVYGVEGRYDWSNGNVQVASTWGDTEFLGDIDLWNLDGGVNIYATPNARIGGRLGWGQLDAGGSDLDTLSAGINGEFQMASLPLSFTAGWNYFSVDDADIDANAFTIGVRWNFGGGTLQERDEHVGYNMSTGFIGRLFGTH